MIPARISGIFSVSTRVGWVRRWYEGLGWQSAREDDVFVPYPVGDGMSFALWSLASAAPNVCAVVAAGGDTSGTLLCTVVNSAAEVDAVLHSVREAGGTVVVADHEVPFGRSGWFLDPAGTTWEVCWIDGRDAAVPFAGFPRADALPAHLAGVTIGSDDPVGLEKFYAEGLGWADRSGEFAGRPALLLEGGALAFSPLDDIPDGLSGGPVPALGPDVGVSAVDVGERLVALGATPAPSRRGPGTRVVDPFGLSWEIVEPGSAM